LDLTENPTQQLTASANIMPHFDAFGAAKPPRDEGNKFPPGQFVKSTVQQKDAQLLQPKPLIKFNSQRDIKKNCSPRLPSDFTNSPKQDTFYGSTFMMQQKPSATNPKNDSLVS
jgi:hypothetical protein